MIDKILLTIFVTTNIIFANTAIPKPIGANEVISPLSSNYSDQTKLAISQLSGTLVGAAINGDAGANTGYNIATSAQLYNRKLHEKEIQLIKQKAKEYAKINNLSEDEARKLFYVVGRSMINYRDTKKLNQEIKSREFLDKYPEINTHSKELKQHISKISDILIKESNSKYYVDINSKKTQKVFTSTYKEYHQNDYHPDFDPTYFDAATSGALAVGGALTTGGLSWVLWGASLARDVKSGVENENILQSVSPDIVSPPIKRNIIGPKVGIGLTGYNIYEQLKKNSDANNRLKNEIKEKKTNANM